MNALAIADLLQARHLSELAGPSAIITDVESNEGFILFSIPLTVPQDFYIGIVCTVYGIQNHRLECSITVPELDHQLRLKRACTLLKHH